MFRTVSEGFGGLFLFFLLLYAYFPYYMSKPLIFSSIRQRISGISDAAKCHRRRLLFYSRWVVSLSHFNNKKIINNS